MAYIIEKTLATLAILSVIGSELNHSFVEKVAWNGFSISANNVSYVLISVWVLALAGLWMQDRVYKFFQLIGVALIGVHGLMLSVGGNKTAVLFYFSMFVISALCSLLMEWRDRVVYN